MRFNTVLLESSYGHGDGAIETQGDKFVIFKKSVASRIAFGAVGAALAQGKEIMRFTLNDIQSCNAYTKGIKTWLRINLNDGKYVVMQMKGGVRDHIYQMLEDKMVNT